MKKITIFLLLLLTVGFISCKRYHNPETIYEEYDQNKKPEYKRKILLISIDGLIGQGLKDHLPENIAELCKNAKYSFDAISDIKTTDPTSWSTMMTGYKFRTHRVEDQSYLPSGAPSTGHSEVKVLSSILYRLESVNPTIRTSVIVQDAGLSNVLLMDADINKLVDSDEMVKEQAVKLLSEEQPDLLLLQFKDVLKAGLNSSFDLNNDNYKSELNKIDSYVGEICKTIKARKNYDYEDWLIIITGNHGGTGNSYGGSTYPERNIFTLYYNKNFKSLEIEPELFYSPRLYGYDGSSNGPKEGVRARNIPALANEAQYNISTTGNLTIEGKIHVNRNAAGNYNYRVPPFFSKVADRTGNTAGWSFFRNNSNVNFYCADGKTKIEIDGGSISTNNTWAQITSTITNNDGLVIVKLYFDGKKVAESTGKLNINNISSTSPLTLGFQPSVFFDGFIDMYMTDIHIWNVALTDNEVLNNAQRIGVPADHPKIANLVGYWPMNDGDNILRNKVNDMPNISLQGNFEYDILQNNLPYVSPEKFLIHNVDVAKNIAYWLQFKINDAWKLEGDSFLSKFEIEFLK